MKVCSDRCEHCIYIGEGDFICDLRNDIVIQDWIAIGSCESKDNKQKGDKHGA